MSSRWGSRTLRVVAFLGVTLAAPLLLVAGTTWDGEGWSGGSAGTSWSNALNWNPDGVPPNDGTADIIFGASTNSMSYVDVSWAINSLTFNNTAGGFFISGSPLTVGAGGIVNQYSGAQSFQNYLILSAPQAWNALAGNITLNGNVANSGYLLTIDGPRWTDLYGNLTGSGGLVKNGTGTLVLRANGTGGHTGPTTVNAGTLALAGSLIWTAPFTVNSGASLTVGAGTIMTGPGTTNISTGASLAFNGTSYLARTVNNSGTATLSGSNLSSTAGGSPIFNNLTGATFDVQADYGLAGTDTATFNNAGTFKKSAGNNTSSITNAWTFNNTGTFDLQGGSLSVAGPFNSTGTVSVGLVRTLTLSGGGTSSGPFSVATGATLTFGGGTNALNAGASITGGGRVLFSGGATTLNDACNAAGGITFSGTPTVYFNGPLSGLPTNLTIGGSLYFNSNAVSFATISQSAGTLGGSAKITVTGQMNWTSGTLSGTGLTEIPVGGIMALSGASAKYLARTLNNSGGATLSGSNLTSTSGGSPIFNNLAGATFDVQADYGLAGTDTATFNNAGMFKKSAGVGTTSITSAWTFNNTGTFDLQSGTVSVAGPFNSTGTVTVGVGRTLTLSGGGTSSGPFSVATGATLTFGGGTNALNAGASITGDGRVLFSGGATTLNDACNATGGITFSGTPTVYFNGPVSGLPTDLTIGGSLYFNSNAVSFATITESAGTLGGSAKITVTGQMNWTGGTMTGFGTTDIPAGASLVLSSASAKYLARSVNNSGAATLAGSNLSSTSGGAPVFNNLAGATFDVQADYGLAGTDTATFNNAGTFKKSAGTGSSITSAWTFNNTGTFDVQSGTVSVAGPFNSTGTVTLGVGRTLALSGGGTSSGPFVLKSNAVLQFGGGDHVLNTGAAVSGWGSVTVSDGTVTLNDLCNPTGGLNISGATVNLNAPGGLTGMPIRLSGGTLASNLALTNSSSVTGFGTIGGTGGFTNNCSVLGSGGALVLSNSGPNVNAGTLGLGAGLQLVLAGGALTNMGSIEVNGGLIMGASALINSVGGIISGAGMIQTPFSNAGGTLRSSTASLNVQQAFSSAGLIEVQNGGGLTGGGITNAGVIQGSGSVANAIVNQGQIECTSGTLFLGGAVTNTATGSISAATGGKVVVATTASENQGSVSLDGGEVRFNQPFVNAKSGRIAGRGRYLFSGGLTNWGQMQFSGGVADVFGAIGLVGGATGGKIINSGSGNLVTFYDDVTHNGAEIRTSADNTTVFFGNVSGAGNFTGPGTVEFEGGYSPGNSPAAVGFEGDAALGAVSSLLMELAGQERGAQYDALLVSGLLVLDGALDVTLLGGYEPRPGDSFDLLDWGTLAGMFDSVSLPDLGAGMAWDTSTLYDSGTITVAPEPATLALVALGAAAMIARRARGYKQA